MARTVTIQVAGRPSEVRTNLQDDHVRRIESRIRHTLDDIRRGRDLPERELFVLGLMTLADEVLALETKVSNHREAGQRLESLIRRVESAFY